MEKSYIIGYKKEYFQPYYDVYVQDTVSYDKVFNKTVHEDDFNALLESLKNQYPNNHCCEFKLY